jgi:hypothetical protein
MGVVVVGMHRSGTSAMTAALRQLGLTAGSDEALIGASRYNPSGHHEIRELVISNELLLQHFGGTWFAPPPYSPQMLEGAARTSLGSTSRARFREQLPVEPWVWKDPRVCLLLPFWRVLLDDNLAAVMIVRAPQDVAQSLRVRNGINRTLGMALWEHYNRAAVHGLSGLPTFVVHYEDLMNDARTTVAATAAFLGEIGAGSTAPDLRAAAACVSDDRPLGSRTVFDGEAVPSGVEQLHHALLDARGTMPDDLARALPGATPGLDHVFDEARRRGYEAFAARRDEQRT